MSVRSCIICSVNEVKMARYFALFILAAVLSSSVTAEYLITTPYQYRVGHNTVAVQLFGPKSCEVDVRLRDRRGNVIALASGNFTGGEKGNLTLRIIPKEYENSRRMYHRNYFDLDATVCGVKTESRSVIIKRERGNNIFIQTDKPIYKPGQKIRMRILSFDKDLKPTGKTINTVRMSVSSSRIKQWNDVKLEDGIASLELQLSKEPVLGKYTITAIVGGVRKSQTIEVAKYVLPKYEVKVTPPVYMALDQKDFTTTICAKYTYGKNVKGTLNAVLCLEQKLYRWSWRPRRQDFTKCQNITKQIDGCTDIVLARDELNVAQISVLWRTRFYVNAQVTETLTGITMKSKAENRKFNQRSVLMSFSGTSNKFKPGLPFKYVLKVTRPDGSPATGSNVLVTISRGWYSDDKFYNKTFVVANGLITDFLNDGTYNARSLVFKAKLLDKNPYPVSDNFYSYAYDLVSSHTASPWYSPSFSYLEILKTQSTPARINSEASVRVRYTVRNNTGVNVDFQYSVMCKGNIVKSGIHTQFHHYTQDENPTTTTRPTTLRTTVKVKVTNTTHSRTNHTTVEPEIKMIAVPRRGWWRPKPAPVKKLNTKPVVETFSIQFPVTREMMPSCGVMVYYVRQDKEVVADSIQFDVEDKFDNQVSMRFQENERKPGEKTNLILEATPGSRVAFVAVDKSVHLLRAGNELTKDKIQPYRRTYRDRAYNRNRKCNDWHPWWRGKRSSPPFWGWGDRSEYVDASEAFNNAGVVFISDLNINTKPCSRPRPVAITSLRSSSGGVTRGRSGDRRPPGNQGKTSVRRKEEPARVRKEFPETWLWADEKLDESGSKTLQVTVPDTITTWVANGFAMSSKTGLGIADTTTLKAFQPFFVQMTLPYSVIRGEEIPVTVTVFNYVDGCAPIKLQLNHASRDYKVTSYHIYKLCVCGDSGHSVKFTIIPTNLGHIPLTVTATTSSAKLCPNSTVQVKDAVTRKLLVEPEGIRKEYTQGAFFCPGTRKHKEVFNLKAPRDVVPGSVYPTVTIIGDIMGPALNNLENLLRMPYGCGEQNMANFAPNIYIMDYLTKTHQVTGDIKNKAENFMEIGYQRELTYKRKSGSYSAFGDRDEQGSMMLTAFVVRSFARAKKYIFVDDNEVSHSLGWFRSKQKTNGCFPQYGNVFNRGLQGGVNSELTITAYVTTALLEAGESTNSTMVSKALSCITSQLDSIKDSYTTALVTYTLSLANHTEANKMMKLLKNMAVKEDDVMYWRGAKTTKRPGIWYYYAPTAEVEMTAYALLAILHQNEDDKSVVTDEIMDIIRWLSKQRNRYGGFSSTQDTCVALQALAEFAGKAYGNNMDFNTSQLTGSLKMGNYFNHDFVVTNENKLILQTIELPAKIVPGKLQVSGQGVGCALIQTSVKYNIPEPEDVPVFDIKVDIRRRRSTPDEEITPCNPLRLHITARWLKEDVSNMAIVDVKLVTGFSVREESLEELRNDPMLNFKRYDIDGQNVQLYFDEIKNMSFSIDIHQDTLVKKLKPAVVKVYDYYEPESQAKVMYKIGEAECYGNKIDTECPKCMTLENADALIKTTVVCNTTVTRIKASKGMLRIVKAFMDTQEKRDSVTKKDFEYQIPDFCPCEEIYDKERAIVIGQKSYFEEDGLKTTVVLNSGTTILKYTGKSMKPQMKKIKKQLNACKRKDKKQRKGKQ